MKANNKISPFDQLMSNYLIQNNKGALSNSGGTEAEVVFSREFDAKLSDEKINSLLNSLESNLSKETLGSLIGKAIRSQNKAETELLEKTGLTISLMESIKTDMVYTNSIPVKSLARLIKLLNLSVDVVKEAINITFDKLSTENKLFANVPSGTMPAFRKGASRAEINLDYKGLKSDESYLYQNKEAMDKYTNRLGELFNEL